MQAYRLPTLLVALVAAAACTRSGTVETAPPAEPAQAPATAGSLPEGTALRVRLDDQLGTKSNRVGDEFTATVVDPVVAQNGETVVPTGAKVHGSVTGLHESSRAGDPAVIKLDFNRLTVNGNSYSFDAAVEATKLKTEGGDTRDETLKKAGIGAAAGAVLGAVLGDADLKSILVGGALGAAAGTAISLGTGDVQGVLPAGTELSLRSTQTVALR
ncbi:MAG TPA: YMGG-like glycine zipper-containing protein [Gemmatimonadaceae bacterium]|nr:YMGG-like glycine zipper-containing protein [Gemmatimonadaceae bacterium]